MTTARNVKIIIGEYNLSGGVHGLNVDKESRANSTTLIVDNDLQPASAFGSTHREFIPGIRKVQFGVAGYWEGNISDYAVSTPQAFTNRTAIIQQDGVGLPAFVFNLTSGQYQFGAQVGAQMQYTLETHPSRGTDMKRLMTLYSGLYIPNAEGFGSDPSFMERNPTSIFKADDGFFIIGDDLNIPMLLDIETGKATHIDPATGQSYPHVFGLSSAHTSWHVADEGASYLIGISLANYKICRISKATLAGAELRALSGTVDMTGLASNGSNIYTMNRDTNKLATLDVSGGTLSDVGSSSDFGVSEGNPTAFAVQSSRTGWMFGGDTKQAYNVNLTTGVATPVHGRTTAGYGNTSSFIVAAYYHQASRNIIATAGDYDKTLKEFIPEVNQFVPVHAHSQALILDRSPNRLDLNFDVALAARNPHRSPANEKYLQGFVVE